MPKTPSSKPRRHSKKFWGLTILSAVCIVGVVSLLIWHYENERAIAADRLRFEQADKEIDILNNNISNTLGRPVKEDRTRSCSQPNTEWKPASLTCHTAYTAFYGVNNESDASNIHRVAKGITLKTFSYKGFKTLNIQGTGDEFEALGDTTQQQIFEEYISRTTHMKCQETYTFYPNNRPPYANYSLAQATPYVVNFSIECSDFARIAYFPRSNI